MNNNEKSIFEQGNENIQDENQSFIKDDRTTNHLPKKKKSIAGKKIGAILMVSGVLIGAVLFLPKFFMNGNTEEEIKPTEETKEQVASYSKPVEQTPPKVFSFDDEPATSDYQGEKLGDVIQSQEGQPVRISKSAGEMMVSTNNGSNQSANTSPSSDGYNYSDSTNKAILSAQNSLNEINTTSQEKLGENNAQADIFKAPTFHAKKARKSQYNPNLLLAQGTYIPCVLRGRLVSNISGQISCIIADNVFSESGNVLLLEKGSRVTGFYQGASVKHGQGEIFVVWQEIRTPNNLIIPIDSGSTDELGANGLSGWVDNHFWERFSNAIILSMIRDVSGALAGRLNERSQNDTENTRQASEEIAKVVLEQMGDIAPTIYKNQGDKIGIFVARDIDFSDVYELKIAR